MDDTENETDTASFTCQATGEPVPTISWYFNDVPVDVTNTVKYAVTSASPGQSTLRIFNVQSSDVGTYTCNATNVVSSNTSSGVLTVNGELIIILTVLLNIHAIGSDLKLLHRIFLKIKDVATWGQRELEPLFCF